MMEFLQFNWVSLCGAGIGILFLYLEYKASIFMWLASIAMAVFFIYIFYTTRLYASMVIYMYFLVASIYGWWRWIDKRQKWDDKTYKTQRVSRQFVMPIIIGVLVVSVLIYIALAYFTVNPQFIKLGDALTASLNIVALWMLSHKWAEQWLLVIPANALSSVLLFVQGDILSGCLFVIYFVVSIAGYYNWIKLSEPPKRMIKRK